MVLWICSRGCLRKLLRGWFEISEGDSGESGEVGDVVEVGKDVHFE